MFFRGSLGLNVETRGFSTGDTLEFQVKIMPLRLSPEQLSKLGLKVGQKFVVKGGGDKEPGVDSGPYIEVGGGEVYLYNLRSISQPHIADTGAGEILTVMGH